MNLYIIIMVEPSNKIPEGAVAGKEVSLTLGGIPSGETDQPWTEVQISISNAVHKWFKNSPQNETKNHRQQRTNVINQLNTGDYNFTFNFNTFDNIDLDCFQDDTSNLYQTLQQACVGSDMVTTKFDSI